MATANSDWLARGKLQSTDQSSLNIFIDGKSGTGKTFFACDIAENIQKLLQAEEDKKTYPDGLRRIITVLHFDKEDGAKSRVEVDKPAWYMFKNEDSTLGSIKEILPSILDPQGKRGIDPTTNKEVVFIPKIALLDTLTGIWREAQQFYKEMIMKGKASGYTKDRIAEGNLAIGDWGKIKEIFYDIQNKLAYSPIHFIALARAGDEYDMSDPNRPSKTGNIKAKTEGESPFEFDILIDMYKERTEKGYKYWGECEKDRWNVINGQTKINPTFEWIKPCFEKLGKVHGLEFNKAKITETNRRAVTSGDDEQVAAQSQAVNWIDQQLQDPEIVKAMVEYETALGETLTNERKKAGLARFMNNKKGFLDYVETFVADKAKPVTNTKK